MSFWNFLKHPITSLVIGIIGVLLAVLFYFLSLKEIKPRYAVSEPELIAEQTLDTPKLKLLWDDIEIKDISSAKIAIWNSGWQYLDDSSISNTDPIRVLIPEGVTVLSSSFIQTSRDKLRFKTSIKTSAKNEQYILIEIDGDEALEHNDGGVLKILFTGKSTKSFVIDGRIKGSKEGFVKTAWSQTSIWETIISIINAIIIFAVIVESQIRHRQRNRLESILYSAIIVFFIYYILATSPIQVGLSSLPNWVK